MQKIRIDREAVLSMASEESLNLIGRKCFVSSESDDKGNSLVTVIGVLESCDLTDGYPFRLVGIGGRFNHIYILANDSEFHNKDTGLREKINVANDNTGGKSMSKASDMMQMVVSMKMFGELFKDDNEK